MPEEEQTEPIVVRLERKTSTEMIGEFLREISALILVFAPLDRYIAEGEVSPEWLTGTLLVSFLLFMIGIAMEGVVDRTERRR
ncbi:MAG TPA: hypothetical protein VN867_01900 [Candidatus Binataceae bacterium]|nr:hypothetical protein [Candidatus Binataceae bacterium]